MGRGDLCYIMVTFNSNYHSGSMGWSAGEVKVIVAQTAMQLNCRGGKKRELTWREREVKNSGHALTEAWGKPRAFHNNFETPSTPKWLMKKSHVTIAKEQTQVLTLKCFNMAFIDSECRAWNQTLRLVVYVGNNLRSQNKDRERMKDGSRKS